MRSSLPLRIPLSIFTRTTLPKTSKPEFQSSKLLRNGFVLPLFGHRLLSTSTRYPYMYEMIEYTPIMPPSDHNRSRQCRKPSPPSDRAAEAPQDIGHWIDLKLSLEQGKLEGIDMDKSKRKYYRKRMKSMHGGDWSDEEKIKGKEQYVELVPEVVEFRSLHHREEELYFYDAFQYPWEKGKHYKMVYLLEKKFFPDQCFDKAFVDPMEGGGGAKVNSKKSVSLGDDEKKLIFFEDEGGRAQSCVEREKPRVMEKKMEKFFKCLRKVPVQDEREEEPYMVTRSGELPPIWDCPQGCVALVNKPKGWSSFTVCGKLRRLVDIQKIGHTGTLDPMATGLLIVCFGNATKLVEKYQDMIKGYSGVFRLGEATSTLDADSPVIQREPWDQIKDRDVRKVAASFCGDTFQVPPMFSAIKVGGERLHEKARRGEKMDRSARRISVYNFDIERSLNDGQNFIFRVSCSKGTYIRSLCADLGKALGSCAHVVSLRRDSIGPYSVDDAWEMRELEEAITRGYM